MQQPLVSILIPAYNAAGTIAAAIDSCLNQTYNNIEIIILDDGSTDNSLRILQQYSTIKYIKNDFNEGTAKARNRLLQHAQGEYIAWLDADDRMMEHRVELQVHFMQNHPEVDIAGSWIFTDNPTIARKKFPLENKIITAFLWFKNCLAQPSIISKNFYTKEHIYYNPEFFYMQDYELWFRLRHQKKFANIPAYLTHYHFSDANAIAAKHQKYLDHNLPEKLWIEKWKANDFGLSKPQKLMLQKFLLGTTLNQTLDIKLLKAVFKIMMNSRNYKDEIEFNWMIHFYRLLFFKNLSLWNKLKNIDLIVSMIYYPKFKKLYLVQ